MQLVQTLLKQFLILSNRLTLLHRKKQLLNAGEGPPTLQSTVIPARNYAPQLLGKVTPTFSPIVNAARKWKSTKNYHPKCANHHENASHPNGFKLWKIINKMTWFNIRTPCKRMIHVCFGKYLFLLQNTSNSNVRSITSTSKKCHLLVQNTMWTHDCMFWYVLVTNLWGSDLHLNLILLQRVPNKAKNEAKTRPKRGQKIALEPPQL